MKYAVWLWLAGIAIQALLTGVLLIKRMWEKFPIFTAYSAFVFVSSATLYLVRHFPNVYFSTYWIGEAVSLLAGLGVVYEVFKKLFVPYAALRSLARTLFRWTGIGLVVLGCVAVLTQSSTEPRPVLAGMLVMEEGMRIVEVGLLMFLFVFASAFGLHWRQYVFGIALGLGIFVSIELMAITMRTHFGAAMAPAFNLVRGFSFDLSLLIWLGYLLAPEAAVSKTDVPKLSQLEQWNQAVMELIHQ